MVGSGIDLTAHRETKSSTQPLPISICTSVWRTSLSHFLFQEGTHCSGQWWRRADIIVPYDGAREPSNLEQKYVTAT